MATPTTTRYCGRCGFTPELDATTDDDRLLIRVATEGGVDEQCSKCALDTVAQWSRFGDVTALVAA